MALRTLIPFAFLFIISCGDATTEVNEADSAFMDSMISARNHAVDSPSITQLPDTEHHTALPVVFDGDIIMQNTDIKQASIIGGLMGGKYNHVGIIFQRKKDGLLMVAEVIDSVRMTPLTDFVDRTGGHVCLLRIKNSNVTLTEAKVDKLRSAGKAYVGKGFDPVLNWDDSKLYSSEFVWKAYNNAMMLTLCPTRKVADFDISPEKQKELNAEHGGQVSNLDEAVSVDDIYNSEKLEVIYEQ